MMPLCFEPRCRKVATKKVGLVINPDDTYRTKKEVYDPTYMCERHTHRFIKKYGGYF